ncbi:MAG: helix-turn-helix domain-containing protein [Elusimicrobia bacterium]|nr:helix-turn-helix domain-containing protein [Candidatus Obscuribacterium magneticum]MCB4755871.1 helix-turn-helix domain-containing protein [Candidatus Obscuribacterium magneticum]
MTKLGKCIREYIEKKNMTLEELAEKIGVSRMTLWRWCEGEAEPSQLALKALESLGLEVRQK